MDRYLKTIEKLRLRYGSEWIKPAMEAVIEVAVQDHLTGNLSEKEYRDICGAVPHHYDCKSYRPDDKLAYRNGNHLRRGAV